MNGLAGYVRDNIKKSVCTICSVVFLFMYILESLVLAHPVLADDNMQELRMVAGNTKAKDKDSFIFVFLGDGFTENEQELFFKKAEETAKYILDTVPFRENKEIFKFYALGCISAETGARGDRAQAKNEEISDSRDTMFHSRYWTDGVQRLLSIDETEEQKALLMAKQYVPAMDYAVVLVNSDTYGGSGGKICVASLHEASVEIVLHELGHTIAGLGDEYWPGAAQMTETANTTRQPDPALVPWADLVGQDGINVYPFADGQTGWYKPSQNCKMQYLGKEYSFCSVCSRELTRAFARHSDAEAIRKSQLFFAAVVAAVVLTAVTLLAIVLLLRKKHRNNH